MTLTDKVVQLRRHVIQRAAARIPVTRVCREAGISRTLFYRWNRQPIITSVQRHGEPKPQRPFFGLCRSSACCFLGSQRLSGY
jgi:hypothetical protein